ncbi:MAG TPA: hypothetical protein PLD25_09920 [Chloroflexota bacterium]|nr:hypothetical protein [Chloroflexota bacterium]HUM72197.1 hypothetical protein [Chloroflexota bacterium]
MMWFLALRQPIPYQQPPYSPLPEDEKAWAQELIAARTTAQ